MAGFMQYRSEMLKCEYSNPQDSGYRRLFYVRYADDWLCGVIGSKQDAEEIKADIKKFLTETLKLELSEEKTLITNARDTARFLSYDISYQTMKVCTKIKWPYTTCQKRQGKAVCSPREMAEEAHGLIKL